MDRVINTPQTAGARRIDDRGWQEFVFGRYREPCNQKPLTALQKVIWECLQLGQGRLEIAAHMGISPGNVDTHVAVIRAKGWEC